MNRILSLGLAAVVTAGLAQPVRAEWRGGGGGGHVSSGGAHVSAPAVHSAPSVAHFSTQSRPHFNSQSFATRSVPSNTFSRPNFAARSAPRTTFSPSVTQNRAFVQPQRNAPSIAFGGTTSGGFRNGGRSFANIPGNVSRGWDRGHVHTWNHHHYRYWNGGWVLFDDGFYGYPYGAYDNGYGYGYGYDQPEDYASQGYTNDDSASGNLVASVQNQLNRLGYATGPADGEFGPMTQNALANFQRDHNLRVTGQMDPMTVRALGVPFQ